ncbi:hypothetical protein [Adhaeribacter pallidiroseus]|uniref:DUF4468 domain-containing protein n=1 Tax=Adhaeribacter pallidiroseus TaxID=2072847 RepID=A0A369QMF5_9BACT|nr:hypothetical protein [Adhaeribacter pallidiroseus]RDC65914.1 hypothetical protein AHMF7616_04545 [Adhaeribacter pallidiroseus]
MKKKLFTAFLLGLLPFLSLSQRLTLEQLIFIYKKKNISDANDYLEAKGWVYNSNKKETGLTQAFTKWVYDGLSDHTVNISSTKNGINAVFYSCNKTNFDAIKRRTMSLKMKKADSGVDDDGTLFTTYVGAKYEVRFLITSSQSFDGKYSVELMDKVLAMFHPVGK